MAGEEAKGLGHPYIGTEHLLLGLLSDRHNAVARSLPAGTTLQVVRRKVEEAVGNGTVAAEGDLSFSPRAKRALERASRFSLQLHAPQVEANHVVLGVLDVEGRAGQVLRGVGMDVGRVRDAAERAAEGTTPAPIAEPVPAQKPSSSPRCPVCGAALDTLSWRALPAKGEGGEVRTFVVAYCAACGSALGTSPGAHGQRRLDRALGHVPVERPGHPPAHGVVQPLRSGIAGQHVEHRVKVQARRSLPQRQRRTGGRCNATWPTTCRRSTATHASTVFGDASQPAAPLAGTRGTPILRARRRAGRCTVAGRLGVALGHPRPGSSLTVVRQADPRRVSLRPATAPVRPRSRPEPPRPRRRRRRHPPPAADPMPAGRGRCVRNGRRPRPGHGRRRR